MTENTQWSKRFNALGDDHASKSYEIFVEAKRQFEEWLRDKATGEFSLTITVNQGGITGRPKINRKQQL